ncbi:MAG TPA: hypothetical protein VLF67_02775, partial [Candidatus Saccharimonas sp.]|nr:hypothetical protein [Candidatus Saccharimonas sp.]
MPPAPQPDEEAAPKHQLHWWMVEVGCAVVLLLIVGVGAWQLGRQSAAGPTANTTTGSPAPSASESPATAATALTLDTTKSYGNKYAGGLLPVGDGKYVTTGAKKGYVYVCNANFVPAGQAGAQTRGPWFTNN